MNFYRIDEALQDAITAADKPVRLKMQIELPWGFETVFERDILEADFFGLKEVAGGTSSRGEILLENKHGAYSYANAGAGSKVIISFSIGVEPSVRGLPYFERFVFYIDHNGVQDIQGPGRKRFVRLGLNDFSEKLRRSDEARDWTAPAVFTYSAVCDKSQPHKSLVHGIAKRAGLSVSDIDCSTIPVTLPYVKLSKNIWAELSDLAKTYRCHLECAPEKPLVFAHSPYQSEKAERPAISWVFTGENVFYLRVTERAEMYRNTVRLKINLPVSLEKQEIWRYDDSPVLYDAFLQAHYPFKYPLVREIENSGYEAHYSVADASGKVRPVIFADNIDTKEEAESRLDFDGGPFSYSAYDVTTNYNKAVLTLSKDADGDLYTAAIYGRPIVLDLNRSCFMRDADAIAVYGTAALNVTGSYFSEYEIDGRPQYEDWAARELAERLRNGREFTVKTHRALFNARVGAFVQLAMSNEQGLRQRRKMKNENGIEGVISGFHFRYRKFEAFVSTFHITEC